jgi:hypothetical protein
VYKSKIRLYDTWLKAVQTTPSGWIENDQFVQWLEVLLFILEVKKYPDQHIFLLDELSSFNTRDTQSNCNMSQKKKKRRWRVLPC